MHIAWPTWWLDKWLISPICCGEIWTISGNSANYLICISSGNSLIFFLFQDWNQKFKFPHASTLQDWLWYLTRQFNFRFTSHYKKKTYQLWDIKITRKGDSSLSMSVHLLARSSKQKFAFQDQEVQGRYKMCAIISPVSRASSRWWPAAAGRPVLATQWAPRPSIPHSSLPGPWTLYVATLHTPHSWCDTCITVDLTKLKTWHQ